MKYVVAPGVCFSNHGKNYEAGAEITADVFNPKSAFDKFVEKGMILPAGGSKEKTAEVTEDSEASADENTENTSAETKSTGSKKGKK